MIVLGLLILFLVAAVTVVMVLRGDDSVRIDLDSLGTYRTDASVVFLVGALTLLVAVIGFLMLVAGLKRARRRRGEMKELRAHARRTERVQRPLEGASSSPQEGDADTHVDSAPRER